MLDTLYNDEKKEDAGLLSPLTLAFLGDGVYELFVREMLVKKGSMPAGKLHAKAVELVKAAAQAKAYDELFDSLSEEEQNIIKRGRNANSTKCPKNANPAEYRKATGIETLFGYLYLKGENERMYELFGKICEVLSADESID